MMRTGISARWVLMLLVCASPICAQQAPKAPAPRPPRAGVGPIQGDKFRTEYVRLGQQGEGLLYEPMTLGPKSRIAVVFTHPGGNNFNAPIGRELASRGYRVLNVNYRGGEALGVDEQLPTVSLAVGYLR